MAKYGLTNALTDIHSEQVPNTHVRGYKKIDFALVTDGISPCIKAVGLLDESMLMLNYSHSRNPFESPHGHTDRSKRPESHPTKENARACLRCHKTEPNSHNYINVMIYSTSLNEAH
jgi:hypothetical protein